MQIFQRRGEAALGARRATAPRKLRKVVFLLPLLDEHLPVGEIDGGDDELRLRRDNPGPVERDQQAPRGEKRTVSGPQPLDRQVVDFDKAAGNQQAKRSDVDGPLQLATALALRQTAKHRPEIDGERADERDRENGAGHRERPAREAKKFVLADFREQFHVIPRQSAPPATLPHRPIALRTRALRPPCRRRPRAVRFPSSWLRSRQGADGRSRALRVSPAP